MANPSFKLQYSPIFFPNTLAFYNLEQNANDATGNYNLITNGVVPYVNLPALPNGNFSAGTFSDTNYFSSPSTFNTAFSNLNSWTIEMNFNLNSMNSGVIWATNNVNVFLQVQADGSMRFGTPGGITVTASSVISTSTNFHVAATWDGINKKIWINNNVRGTGNESGNLGTITNNFIGRYGGNGNPNVNGYLKNVRFSNVARTSFPTVDIR